MFVFVVVPPHTENLNAGWCHYVTGCGQKYIFPLFSTNSKMFRFQNAPILRLFLWCAAAH